MIVIINVDATRVTATIISQLPLIIFGIMESSANKSDVERTYNEECNVSGKCRETSMGTICIDIAVLYLLAPDEGLSGNMMPLD